MILLPQTIVALSSGAVPSGVAVIRLSGPDVQVLLADLIGTLPPARQLVLRSIRDESELVDRGLIAFFPGPQSFTGEDCAELQVHGSPAVVRALLRVLTRSKNVRLASPGEFTRRAFDNGKLDLTAVEGLGDLIDAETENQRILALGRLAGGLSDQVDMWRAELIDLRAEIEARLDFSDEDDVDETLPDDWQNRLANLEVELQAALLSAESGRIVREGFRVALAGAPNAGKSSLINALAKSDLAIVSTEAGTTRDIREVPLDIGGQLVVLVDMAGLRETDSLAEAEGVRRAHAEIARADLVLWLQAPDQAPVPVIETDGTPVWIIGTKSDISKAPDSEFFVSARDGDGLQDLLKGIGEAAIGRGTNGNAVLLSRERDVAALKAALDTLKEGNDADDGLELRAERLRLASDCLARLVGRLDSELILDRLFSSFCIGK